LILLRQTGIDLTISKASKSDLVLLNRLNTQPHTAGTIFEVPIYHGITDKHNTTVFVAKNKSELVGFASVRIIDSSGKRLAVVEHFGISPKYHRRRIGNKLLGTVNAFLIKNKVAHGNLVSSLKGMLFYPKTNWKLVSERVHKFEWVPKANPRVKLRKKIKG